MPPRTQPSSKPRFVLQLLFLLTFSPFVLIGVFWGLAEVATLFGRNAAHGTIAR